ncbi:hypothetical protein BASA83_005356 [Batrachochytrium salamandrivorans]|nr:hypothetical protein BASA83_005356 [Batrachochytrium salamandrivorans]
MAEQSQSTTTQSAEQSQSTTTQSAQELQNAASQSAQELQNAATQNALQQYRQSIQGELIRLLEIYNQKQDVVGKLQASIDVMEQNISSLESKLAKLPEHEKTTLLSTLLRSRKYTTTVQEYKKAIEREMEKIMEKIMEVIMEKYGNVEAEIAPLDKTQE